MTGDSSRVLAQAVPRIRLGEVFRAVVDWLTDNLAFFFDALGSVVNWTVNELAGFFAAPVILGLALVFGLIGLALRDWKVGLSALAAAGILGYLAALVETPTALVLAVVFGIIGFALRGWKFGVFSTAAFLLVDAMGQWKPAMDTLALVLVASVIAVAVAVPLGIAAGRGDSVSRVVKPVLDFM